jgi:glucosylceramidase
MIRITRTARDTAERLSELPPVAFGAKSAAPASILLDPTHRFQEIEGFGGAFTESAAAVLLAMPPAVQEEILRAYFDPNEGHGYTLCRTHINSCDFSLENWACDDTAGDVKLEHFSIARDKKYMIPMIKRAQALSGGRLKLFASPWSPPAWMKTNGEMNHGGQLRPEFRQAWADYYVRFIREYAREGIDIWGLTVQNEPAAVQVWDSCIYSAEEERDFVRDHLGPTLARAGLGHVRLMIWDHNRDIMVERVRPTYDDPAAAQYVWGTAFHWYGPDCFDNCQVVHDTWPEKKLLFTEGCQEGGPHLGSWDVGERYGRSVIKDLNRWTVGWTDWNLLLDMQGGPNHVGNLCSAPILADAKTGKATYHSSYFYLGHFSRFIRPGARRILCAPTRDDLESAAFINVDNTVAVVVMNRTDKEQPFALKCCGSSADTVLPPHAIATYTFPVGGM